MMNRQGAKDAKKSRFQVKHEPAPYPYFVCNENFLVFLAPWRFNNIH